MVVNVPQTWVQLSSDRAGRHLHAAEKKTNKPEKEFFVQHEKLRSARVTAAAVAATDRADS